MATVAKGVRQVNVGHVCSKCGGVLVQKVDLYAEGKANAFFHEKDMAIEARDLAFEQAFEDIVLCYKEPRMLGSYTDVPTDSNRTCCYYRYQGLDTPCPTCGHIEPWQLRKKSLWNPMDGAFEDRELIPDVPMESRPVLLRNKVALEAWVANPTDQELIKVLLTEPVASEE